MDGENGRRLNTNANVPDNLGEKPTPPFSIANSERSSISSSKQDANGNSPAKISVSSHNVPNLHVEPLCRNGKTSPIEASCRLEKSSITDSPGSFKRSSDVARNPFVLTESPAIQVMERPKTSEPNTVPTESPNRWSVDSNDSLFSIHMGNGSFSKDRSLSISGDIGELSLSEAYLPRVSPKSGELHQCVEPYNSPAAAAAAAAAKALDEARKAAKEEVQPVADQPKCDPLEASISIHTDSNLSRSNDPNPSHDDNKGCNETYVPPSTSASACPICRCLWCDGASSCCRSPSCNCSWFRWPSCSNFCISCPSCSKCCGSTKLCSCCCYSWNRETKRVRSVSSYALMDRGVASSSKHKV